MLYYQDNQWHCCTLKMLYTEYGVPTYKCIYDKEWWINFSNKWNHINNLTFEYLTPSVRQLERLDLVNTQNIPEGFMSEVDEFVYNGRVLNPDNIYFQNIIEDPDLDIFKEELYVLIEQKRVENTQLMPWVVPSSGTNIEIKIGEEPPDKPRMSWLSGNCSWGLIEVQAGNTELTDILIAADDSLHELTVQEWIEFGRGLKHWIGNNVIIAKTHLNNVKALTTLQDILDYDYQSGW